MPTYSYHCDACDGDFEKEQRITEAAIKKCQVCGKLRARRMISSGNFILKGGGWYSDAYGLKPSSKFDSESSSSSGSKSSSASASKSSGDSSTKTSSASTSDSSTKSTDSKTGGDASKSTASSS